MELDAARHCGGTFRLVQFDHLPEMLRAIGRYVENKQGELLRINTDTSFPTSDAFVLEYETRDGQFRCEELRASAMADLAMRMYRIRLHGNAQRDRRI